MASITFTNPDYKTKTVYAVAGSHTESVLQIAKANNIPIDFNCGDGECGTCLINVEYLGKSTRLGGPLTEKEKTVLLDLKKITKEEIEQMEVDDLPTPWRLACQIIVRDEDMLVRY